MPARLGILGITRAELERRLRERADERTLEAERKEITDAKSSPSLKPYTNRIVRDEKNDEVYLYFEAENGRRFRVELTEVT